MSGHNEGEELLLPGLDGANPLAFLAALGTLRIFTLDGSLANRAALIDILDEQLSRMLESPALSFADDLTVPAKEFRRYADAAMREANHRDRVWPDFAAAFGSDAFEESSGSKTVIHDTAFRTMSGAGHQHFLKFMRNIVAETDAHHIEKALFAAWRYDDPVENRTLRWDPEDDQRYGLRWRNPSGDPARKRRGSVLGANRLAIEGLPLFPTAPVGRRLQTTGFRGRTATDTALTWPIWVVPTTLEVCRSLLALEELQQEPHRIQRDGLRARGIVEIFRARRITVGKYRNFTPSEAV